MAIRAMQGHRAFPVQLLSPDDTAVGAQAGELRREREKQLRSALESIFRTLRVLNERLQLRLTSLRRLQPNWDSYGAPAPNELAANNIERVLRLLQLSELSAAQIVPSSEGGLAICFVNGERYADIESSNDGELVGVHYVGRELPQVFDVAGTEESLQAAVELIRNHIRG